MPCPRAVLADEWDTLGDDAIGFLNAWGERAAALGWPSWALFGVHADVPNSFRGRELVALLGGPSYGRTASAVVSGLTAEAATIRAVDGARLVYRLRPRDPLSPSERRLLWEIEPHAAAHGWLRPAPAGATRAASTPVPPHRPEAALSGE